MLHRSQIYANGGISSQFSDDFAGGISGDWVKSNSVGSGMIAISGEVGVDAAFNGGAIIATAVEADFNEKSEARVLGTHRYANGALNSWYGIGVQVGTAHIFTTFNGYWIEPSTATGTQPRLRRRVGTTDTTLWNSASNIGDGPHDFELRYKVNASDVTLEVWINGNLETTYVDNDPSRVTNCRYGFLYAETGGTMDSLWDDFELLF